MYWIEANQMGDNFTVAASSKHMELQELPQSLVVINLAIHLEI